MELKTRFENRELKAEAELVSGVWWIHFGGRTFAVDPRRGTKKRGRAGAGPSGEALDSPMPGKITKLLRKTGDSVKKGDAVVVMEAMKMEYTLKAEADATVEELCCQTGDQVALGQRLVKLKPVTA